MTVAVVVDSAASLPSAVAAELGITVVPMALVVDGHPMTDREISVEALAAHLDGGSVSTSGPNAGDFVRAIEQARAGADDKEGDDHGRVEGQVCGAAMDGQRDETQQQCDTENRRRERVAPRGGPACVELFDDRDLAARWAVRWAVHSRKP